MATPWLAPSNWPAQLFQSGRDETRFQQLFRHESMLEQHVELVVRFLTQTLRAAHWASSHKEDVLRILQDETKVAA